MTDEPDNPDDLLKEPSSASKKRDGLVEAEIVSEEQVEAVAERVLPYLLSITREMFYTGPIPHASDLLEYDKIEKGTAKGIIEEANREGRERRRRAAWVVIGGVVRSFLGVIFGFIIGMTAIIGGFYVILSGFSVAGTIVAGLGLVSLVGVFVYGTRSRLNDGYSNVDMDDELDEDEGDDQEKDEKQL